MPNLIPVSKENLEQEPVNGLSKTYLIKVRVQPIFGLKNYFWATAILYETHCPEPNKRWFGWQSTGFGHLEDVLEIYLIE